jgi:GDP-4-dehydro-6-deoxy-D-mannose reductase
MPGRILITGAAGFVGRHLLATLRRDDAAAELLTPDQAECDITDAAALDRLVAACRPTACVHLAGIAAIPAARRDPAAAWRVNLDGTLNLARALLAHAPEAALLFVSSADVYGGSFRAGRPLDEQAPLAPLNTYAATKAAADLALGALAAEGGLRVVRLRPFNHTGPGQSDAFVVPAFARQVARIAAGRQPPRLQVGALAPERDFLDVRDVCAAYAACLRAVGPEAADPIPPGTIVNLASGVPRRIGDVLAALLARAGVAAEIETTAHLLRPSDIAVAAGEAGRAAALLGWRPVVPWEQTLDDVLDDWRRRVAAEG